MIPCTWRKWACLLLGALILGQALAAEDDRRAERRARRGEGGNPEGRRAPLVLPAAVQALQALSVVLGRPTDQSVTASVVSTQAREAYLEYGARPGRYEQRSEIVKLAAGIPQHLQMGRLAPNSRVYYRLRHRLPGEVAFVEGREQGFHTARPPGSPFVFEIQGDSHPERRHQFDAAMYAQTLSAVAADQPDFYLLMGDDFSVDTLHEVNAETVTGRYALQRPFLSLVGQGVPLFLVNGNHEQAALANLDGTANNVAVWAQKARDAYFPQPGPDGFYSGDAEKLPHIGLLRDYYAWTWGDALFVVIDPYWHSPKPVDNVFGGGGKQRDLWAVTLGETQYRWLQRTLEGSKARYKFVFSHHVLGTGRGGVEMAALHEWGGRNRRGQEEFSQYRPGWEQPIHRLLVKTGVSIFFQGHDHLFARQELDGVIYQTLPQPADPNQTLNFAEAYRSGEIRPNSGRVRVTVAADQVKVEYLLTLPPSGAGEAPREGPVAYSYRLPKKP